MELTAKSLLLKFFQMMIHFADISIPRKTKYYANQKSAVKHELHFDFMILPRQIVAFFLTYTYKEKAPFFCAAHNNVILLTAFHMINNIV